MFATLIASMLVLAGPSGPTRQERVEQDVQFLTSCNRKLKLAALSRKAFLGCVKDEGARPDKCVHIAQKVGETSADVVVKLGDHERWSKPFLPVAQKLSDQMTEAAAASQRFIEAIQVVENDEIASAYRRINTVEKAMSTILEDIDQAATAAKKFIAEDPRTKAAAPASRAGAAPSGG